MRIAIVNDNLLKVVNVVKANSVDDVESGIIAESWMAPNVEYTINDDGVRIPIPPTPIPINELIALCDNIRNSITESEITAGFEWPPIDGVIFRMTAENQRNFTNLDRMADKGLLTYPYTIWCGEESVELEDAQAVENFYLAGVSFITQKLNEGKNIRASFRSMTRQELEAYKASNA